VPRKSSIKLVSIWLISPWYLHCRYYNLEEPCFLDRLRCFSISDYSLDLWLRCQWDYCSWRYWVSMGLRCLCQRHAHYQSSTLGVVVLYVEKGWKDEPPERKSSGRSLYQSTILYCIEFIEFDVIGVLIIVTGFSLPVGIQPVLLLDWRLTVSDDHLLRCHWLLSDYSFHVVGGILCASEIHTLGVGSTPNCLLHLPHGCIIVPGMVYLG
jgi:hypothetical protein